MHWPMPCTGRKLLLGTTSPLFSPRICWLRETLARLGDFTAAIAQIRGHLCGTEPQKLLPQTQSLSVGQQYVNHPVFKLCARQANVKCFSAAIVIAPKTTGRGTLTSAGALSGQVCRRSKREYLRSESLKEPSRKGWDWELIRRASHFIEPQLNSLLYK